MDKNTRLKQTDTGAADRGALARKKMYANMTGKEFSDIPGGYGLPMKEAQEKVKKLEAQQKAKEADDTKRRETRGMKKGGKVSASKRADGCAQRGKTRGKVI